MQIGKCAKELIGDMHTDNGGDAGTWIREAFMETMLSTLYKTDAGARHRRMKNKSKEPGSGSVV